MRRLLACLPLFLPLVLLAQTAVRVSVEPVFRGEKIALEQPLRTLGGDSLALHTLRFYLGNCTFWKNGKVVFKEKNRFRLLDLEDENSLRLAFDFPEKTPFDSLRFLLGVDSLTTAAGAMGGDLDPTKGMFWTWQSGYINFKIEGFSSKSTARHGLFEFHLGGYLPPFQSQRWVGVALPGRGDSAKLLLELAPFFEAVDWAKKPGVMSPGAEAVRLSDVLAKSFQLHEN